MARTFGVLWLAAATAAACGDGGDATDDAGSDAAEADVPADDGGRDPGTEAEAGLPLVRLSCYELEIAVNADAPAGRSRVRFYGGFGRADGVDEVTNASVEVLEVIAADGTRAATSPEPPGGNPLDPLPEIQQEVFAWIDVTAAELAACAGATPGLRRGTRGADDLQVRMAGSSDQGRWEATCGCSGEDLIRTCHSGMSAIADGLTMLWPAPDPPGGAPWPDLSATVRLRDAPAFDTVEVTSLVMRAEGTATTFVAPEPWGSPCSSSMADCISLLYQGEGVIDELCPPPSGGMPPESYLTYEGSAGGAAFAGAAPAGQCQNFTEEM